MNLGELEVHEVNLILKGLGELPAKESFQLLGKLLVLVNKPAGAPDQTPQAETPPVPPTA